MQFLILPLLLLAMWALVIRPQQQRIRAQQAVVATLEVGDEVISSAGIYGEVLRLDDDIAILRVAPGVELKLARQAIVRKAPVPEPLDDQPVVDLSAEPPAERPTAELESPDGA